MNKIDDFLPMLEDVARADAENLIKFTTTASLAGEELNQLGSKVESGIKELKQKYSKHDLISMWAEFKSLFSDRNLKKYDKVVSRYNKWKEVRYPTERKSNMIMFSDIHKGNESKMLQPHYKKEDEYRINLEELDELFKNISIIIGINPDYVKNILFGDNLKTYERENQHIVWQT